MVTIRQVRRVLVKKGAVGVGVAFLLLATSSEQEQEQNKHYLRLPVMNEKNQGFKVAHILLLSFKKALV